MSQDVPVTGYAILGLLTFGDELTGYEIKQRADVTLRFYWVSPAMSQIYTELRRLADHGLVRADARPDGGREVTSYAITDAGQAALRTWMAETPAGLPVLKHPVLLRLLVGILRPNAGGVYLDGHATSQWDRRELARHLGYLPQEALLSRASVAEAIARLEVPDMPEVLAAAQRAGAHATVIGLPFWVARARSAQINRWLTIGSGLLSLVFGLYLGYQIGFVDGLFTGDFHWEPA